MGFILFFLPTVVKDKPVSYHGTEECES